jgi:hypothetical protein
MNLFFGNDATLQHCGRNAHSTVGPCKFHMHAMHALAATAAVVPLSPLRRPSQITLVLQPGDAVRSRGYKL